MSKKAWRKPEVRKIEAGAAESNPGNGSDGATTGSKGS